jgi:prepilin-type N-terminal cleavage/methylation domain-containing protein
MNRMNNSAFSLVELSIVLVILGLLTGGILTGQSLIKAAELRSVATEYNQFVTAVNTFKGKYFALPGDMSNAEAFWLQTAGGCPETGATDLNPGTCDGNGDGELQDPNNNGESGEIFTFWQHLSLARLINGEFTGSAGANDEAHHIVGTNTPVSKFSGAGWGIEFYDASPGTDFFNISYDGNILEFGAPQNNNDMDDPIMIPEDAWNIDKKLDDGKPAQGNIIARRTGANGDCTTAADHNDLDADYLLSEASVRCNFIFNSPL